MRQFEGRLPYTLFCCVVVFGASRAGAADVPTPGAIGDTLPRPAPVTPPPLPSPPVAAPAPVSVGTPAVATAPAARRFTVRGFRFEGNTVFPATALAALLGDYLDRPLAIADLYAAADRVAGHYARQGYPLASVNVPPQRIGDGTVLLSVVEGRIGRIAFDGNRRYADDLLGAFVHDTRPGEAYRAGSLERDLQALNALPGLLTRGVLQPGREYGTTDVVVKASETFYDGALIADDYGRSDIGEFRYTATVTLHDPFRAADELQLLALHSNTGRLDYGYAAYSVPLDTRGLRFKASYGQAHFEVDTPAPRQELAPPAAAAPAADTVRPAPTVTGDNRNLDLGLELPIRLDAGRRAVVGVGVSYTDADADFVTGDADRLALAGTRITLLDLVADYRSSQADGSSTAVVGSLRTDFQPAREERRDAGQPLRLEIDAQQLLPLPWWRVQLLARVAGVYSPEPLPDTEQFSLGGPGNLRGFPPSEVRGDRGAFASLGLQRAFFLARTTLVPRLFLDTGIVAQLATADGDRADHEARSDVGLGLDVLLRQGSLRLDWARPLGDRTVSDGRDESRVFGALTVNLR